MGGFADGANRKDDIVLRGEVEGGCGPWGDGERVGFAIHVGTKLNASLSWVAVFTLSAVCAPGSFRLKPNGRRRPCIVSGTNM